MVAFRTEAEAAEVWCPLSRVSVLPQGSNLPPSPAFNRTMKAEKFACPKAGMCIGSQCMAWRWKLLGDGGVGLPEAKYGGGKEPVGYCGQFGHPFARFSIVS